MLNREEKKAITIQNRISEKQRVFIEAYQKSAGNISHSCKIANIARQTYYEWIDKSDKFKSALEDIIEENHDFVESKLLQAIKEDNLSAIQFYLKTKAKDRGYTEQQKLDIDSNSSLRIEFID
jgi:hypothetical protein